jgi:hypothetical protein
MLQFAYPLLIGVTLTAGVAVGKKMSGRWSGGLSLGLVLGLLPTSCSPTPSRRGEVSGGRWTPCPLCGGRLDPTRGSFRCSRCQFAICEGCESEGVHPTG